MSRDGSYKPKGSIIVTIPITPELHKRLRIYAITKGQTVKAAVTDLLEKELP